VDRGSSAAPGRACQSVQGGGVAADLFAVDAVMDEDLGLPRTSFALLPHRGTQAVLMSSSSGWRLGRESGYRLQTAFGGGKTHTMLAAYHLAKSPVLEHLEGVGGLFRVPD